MAPTTRHPLISKPLPQSVSVMFDSSGVRCQVCHAPVTTAIGRAHVARRENLASTPRASGDDRTEPATTIESPPNQSTTADMCTASTPTASPAGLVALGCPDAEKVTTVAAPTSAVVERHHDVVVRWNAPRNANMRAPRINSSNKRTMIAEPSRVSATSAHRDVFHASDHVPATVYGPCRTNTATEPTTAASQPTRSRVTERRDEIPPPAIRESPPRNTATPM